MARQRFFATLITLLFLATTAFGDSKRPPVVFDEEETPLQKAVKETYKENARKKKDKMPGGDKKDRCADAIEKNNIGQIAAQCDDVAIATLTPVGKQNFTHADGKSAGKRIVTKTVLEYKSPKQKHNSDLPAPVKWEATTLKKFERAKEHLPGPAGEASGQGRGRSYGSFLPDPANNDDNDCLDMLSGQHLSGAACFDGDGKLLATLTPSDVNGTTGCTHRDGSVFFGSPTDAIEDDCWDEANALKTTLIELIDEDGAEALDNDGDGAINEDLPDGINNDNDCLRGDGVVVPCGADGKWGETPTPLIDEDGVDSVDNDGDGQFDEDGIAVQTESDCARLYRKAGLEPKPEDEVNGECDMSRALVKFVNDESLKKPNGKKIFKAKDDGTFDPEGPDGIEPGTEERKVTITESFGVKCKRGTTFLAGVCVPDSEVAAAGGERVALMKIFGKPDLRAVKTSDGDDPVIDRVAMMGFTFAPPVIEWGYRIDEDVCVLGICIEIFYARIGYEFDLAIGVRLPVQIDVLDKPESILAGTSETIQTTLTPLDFTTSQYEQFCEHNNLDDDPFIGGSATLTPCRRFGFTNFLDEMVPVIGEDKKDGDEFVARYSIFAGIVVRVFMIPVINWAVDSSLDLPAACTMMRILEIVKEPGEIDAQQIASFVAALMGFGGGLEEGAIELINFIKEEAGACGTFETPFGVDDDGAIRGWPFSGEYSIRADCAEAFARGEVITIKGQPRPICTNMILGVSGASLGVGLGLEARAGSNLIRSDFSTSEDASGSGVVRWRKAANESSPEVGLTITADNYDDADHRDTARVALDDFVYYLNLIEIALKANLQFGGILSPIPDIGSFNIYRFQISLSDIGDDIGLPIPQHAGTDALAINVPVENYGLTVDVKPQSSDASVRIDNKTLLVKPGEFGPYQVQVRNIGSRDGSFDNFRVALSNRPDQLPAGFTFVIDRNTDHDCVPTGSLCNSSATHFRGDPWDGIADACYAGDGSVRAGMSECVDEDPVSAVQGLSRSERDDDGDGVPDEDPAEGWVFTPAGASLGTIAGLAPYTSSSLPVAPAGTSLAVSVSPFRHPLTRPGKYPFEITADSVEAKTKSMAHVDPSGNARVNAKDVAFVQVASFFEPQVVVLPNSDGGKAGQLRSYTVEGTNGGNVDDSMTLSNEFLDFNQGACTLTTLGRLPGGSVDCPYRAVPTAIPGGWTTVNTLAPRLPDPTGLLEPLGSATDAYVITPPRDWAGMDDTTYAFRVTTVSQADPGEPAATRTFVGRHTVTATKESMTRYVGLEIDSMIEALLAAEANGLKLGGLKPIAMKPVKSTHTDALTSVVAGDFGVGSKKLSTTINLMEAYVKALEGGGKGLPPDFFADLQNRSAAILADLAVAQASTIPSAP